MDSWYDIVKSYDDPKSKEPNKKNDGTYSQSSVVILLIYLTFGEDHPYHIARYFEKIFYKPLDPDVAIPYSSNLRTTKVGTLLNKMKEDGLVKVREDKVNYKVVKTYSVNPRIIQSPIRDGTYLKRDGSAFEIPLEMIEQFLPWRDLQWKEQIDWSGRDGCFKHVVYPATIDFLFFIAILKSLANQQNGDIERNRTRYAETSPFEELLEEYMVEINYHNKMEELSKSQYQTYLNPFTGKKEILSI
jgi:predicted transcriptional regulator